MALKKRKKLGKSYGITLNYVNFTVKSRETLQEILQFYGEAFFKTQGVLGSGVMKYTGNWNEDNSVFIGGNDNGTSFLVRFEGDAGMIHLDNFRKEFLYKSENSSHLSNISTSSLQSNLVITNTVSPNSSVHLRSLFEAVVQAQQKSQPKVSINSGELLIGGKTSSVSLSVIGLPENSVVVEDILVSLKLKDAGAATFYTTLQSSISSSIKDIIAQTMYTMLSKITLTDFTEMLRVFLTKEYNIGGVISATQVQTRSVGKTGQYIRRVLSGVTNKLLDSDFAEVQSILIEWLITVYALRTEIKKSDLLFKDICSAVSGGRNFNITLPAAKVISRGRTRKTPSMSPSPATFDFLKNTTGSEVAPPPRASRKSASKDTAL